MSAAKRGGAGAAKKSAPTRPAKKAPAKKAPAKNAAAKKAPAKKAPAKKAPAKNAPAKKAPAKNAAATNAPAKKTAPDRTAAKNASHAKATRAPAKSEVSARPVVLLVDDFPDAREMYLEYLDFSGFSSAEASNGLEAIEQALELGPAVILMDLAMPVMDGWEATRRLKADPRTRSIPVIAVTGHALEGDAERARQAGCDGVLSKPCLPENLVAEVRRLLAGGKT